MRILAIDPGNKQSAYVVMEDWAPVEFGKENNEDILQVIHREAQKLDACIVEMVASYGLAVGKDVFETCVWIGRFSEAAGGLNCQVDYIYRMEEKMNLCHNSKAKDANIRQALIDRFAGFDFKNGKGTKKKPDFFYGFAKDVWAAYATGTTWLDKKEGEKNASEGQNRKR